MVETANPEINVEDLMLRIREEVALCKAQVSIAEVAWYAQVVAALNRTPENR